MPGQLSVPPAAPRQAPLRRPQLQALTSAPTSLRSGIGEEKQNEETPENRSGTRAGGRPTGPVPPKRSAGRAYRASCGSGPGRPMASHGLSALRQETPARKTASASFPPPAPDSSPGTRSRAASGTLLLPLLWPPWPVTVWAGERPGGGDGPSPCRPTPLCKEEPAASRARGRGGWPRGVATASHAPCTACRGQIGPALPSRLRLLSGGRQNIDKLRPHKARSLPQVASCPLKKGKRISEGRSVLGPAPLALASHLVPQWGGAPGRGGAGLGARWAGPPRPSEPRGGAPLRTPSSRALSELARPGLAIATAAFITSRRRGQPRPGPTIGGSAEPSCLGGAILSCSALLLRSSESRTGPSRLFSTWPPGRSLA